MNYKNIKSRFEWNDILYTLFLIAFLIALCMLSVVILNKPAYNPVLDLSDSGTLGDAVGGLTAPILGIISSVLLYRALIKQIESNEDQKLKNESDNLFALINQLNTEINSFYFKFNNEKVDVNGKKVIEEKRYFGVEALNDFTREFRFEYDLRTFKHTSKNHYQANQMRLLMRSYLLIEERVKDANISKTFKSMFTNKLQSIFDCILFEPFDNINEAIKTNPHLKDEITQEIKEFVELRKHETNIATNNYQKKL